MKTPRIQYSSHVVNRVFQLRIALPQNPGATFGGPGQSHETTQSRRLSCSVRTKKTGDATGLNFGGEIVDCGNASVDLRQPSKGNRDHHPTFRISSLQPSFCDGVGARPRWRRQPQQRVPPRAPGFPPTQSFRRRRRGCSPNPAQCHRGSHRAQLVWHWRA